MIKTRILLLIPILIIIILFVGSCRKAGSWLVKEDKPGNADTMVILMGSISDRVLHAMDLYAQGLAGKVILVDTNHPDKINALEERRLSIMSNTMQSRNALASSGVPSDSIIILPGGATSTQMEAVIVREYLSVNSEIDTLLLISSSEHTRRASMIFRAAFKASDMPVTILCSPSRYTDFNAEKWWKSKEDVQAVLWEYLKIANFLMFEKRKLK